MPVRNGREKVGMGQDIKAINLRGQLGMVLDFVTLNH